MACKYDYVRKAVQVLALQRLGAREGFLYLAAVIGTDSVKIGFSRHPHVRIRHVQSRNLGRVRCRLVGFTRATLTQEHELHRALRAHSETAHGREFYPRSILSHPAIPAELRVSP